MRPLLVPPVEVVKADAIQGHPRVSRLDDGGRAPPQPHSRASSFRRAERLSPVRIAYARAAPGPVVHNANERGGRRSRHTFGRGTSSDL